MPKIPESGNAVNIANYKFMIDQVTAFGTLYKPSNPALTVTSLTAQWTEADNAQSIINGAIQKASPLIAKREVLFAPVNKLVTRSLNIFNSIKTLPEIKKNAKSIADNYRGVAKYKPKPKPGDTKAEDPSTATKSTDPEKEISTSHQGYVQKLNTLDSYIKMLIEEPLYVPAETDLTVDSFKSLYTQMKDANDKIGTIIAPVDNARIARDAALYTPETGLLATQKAVKKYVIGVFGSGTPKAHLITKIRFRKNAR